MTGARELIRANHGRISRHVTEDISMNCVKSQAYASSTFAATSVKCQGGNNHRGRAVFRYNDMFSSHLGRSTDTLGSPRNDPSAGQYSFPQSNSPERHGSSGYYGARRDSAASSITSIGDVLDSSAQGVEVGKNGMFCHVLQQPV